MAALTRLDSLGAGAMHSRALPTTFEPYQLDIDKFIYAGIPNRSLFAYKALDGEAVCTYLRIMDLEEYQQVLKEHTQMGKAGALKGPVITTTVVGTALAGVVGTVVAGPFGGVCATIKAACVWGGIVGYGCGALCGTFHYRANMDLANGDIAEKRADRLTKKIYSLADRIDFLEKEDGNSRRELLQLKVANACFQRALQVYTNKITLTVTHR